MRSTDQDDPFNLQRFVLAQDPVFERVQRELGEGRKRSHWMWFVFPQFAGAGGHNSSVDIAILGLTYLLLQFASGCLYCYFGQRIKHVLENPQRRVLLQRATAVLLLGVAFMLARGFSH